MPGGRARSAQLLLQLGYNFITFVLHLCYIFVASLYYNYVTIMLQVYEHERSSPILPHIDLGSQ